MINISTNLTELIYYLSKNIVVAQEINIQFEKILQIVSKDSIKPVFEFIGIFPPVLTVLATFTNNFENIILFTKKYIFRESENISKKQENILRDDLINVLFKDYHSRWMNSLDDMHPIDIESCKSIKTYIGSSENFSSIKTDNSKLTLILGKSSSGKTFTLLTLSREILRQARLSSKRPIPVIFDLSEWDYKFKGHFVEWLALVLHSKYQIPHTLSKKWIYNNKLLLMLDGLDELENFEHISTSPNIFPSLGLQEFWYEILRCLNIKKNDASKLPNSYFIIQCVKDIDSYVYQNPQSIYICSREQQYKEFKSETLLNCENYEVYLNDVSFEDIKRYLKNYPKIRILNSINEIIESKSNSNKQSISPVLLIYLLKLNQKFGIEFHDKNQLIDEYINKKFDSANNYIYLPNSHTFFTPETTKYYLGFLASKLIKNNVRDFQIEDLQANWIDVKKCKYLYIIYVGLGCGLLFGTIEGLLWWYSHGLKISIYLSIVYGVISGFFLAIDANFSNIKPVWKIHFSWSKIFDIKKFSLCLFLTGFIISYMITFILGAEKLLSLNCSLITGILFLLLSGIKKSNQLAIKKMKPNQGIWISSKNGLLAGFLFCLPSSLFFGYLSKNAGVTIWLHAGFSSGIFFLLVAGLIGGWNEVIKHIALRKVLYQFNFSPYNYVEFLKYAENLQFIQKNGGRYRFVNDEIKIRFSEIYKILFYRKYKVNI